MKKSKKPFSTEYSRFELIVIGSGPAGQHAAMAAAHAGKKVALIEKFAALGGGCLHSGTLPSKSFRESVYRWCMSEKGRSGKLPDMLRLLQRKERVVRNEQSVIADQMKRNHVTTFHGSARFLDAHRVEVIGRGKNNQIVLESEVVIIAVGAQPRSPAHLPVDGKQVLDHESILSLKRLPKRMVVLGGGIIGCEYGSMFAMAGTQVTIVDKRPQILSSVDREIGDHLMERFKDQGVKVILEAEATRIEKRSRGAIRVHLSSGRKVETDVVLVAMGRFGNTTDLGLENVGIRPDERGLIQVDPEFRTSVSNIFAVGDVIGPPSLASTSMEQGRVAACSALGVCGMTASVMEELFPYGIYTIPEISMIGATEEELKAKGISYVVGRAKYREVARGQIVGDHWGLLKLIVDDRNLKILGVHIVGDNAAELVHIGQAVMALNGDLRYFIRNVFNYPTLAEAYKTAAFSAANALAKKG